MGKDKQSPTEPHQGPVGTTVRLYELTDRLQDLQRILSENGGEITPEQERALEQLDGDWNAKLANCVAVIKNLEAEAKELLARKEIYSAEAKRLAGAAWTRSQGSEKLRAYIAREMARLLVDSARTPDGHTVTLAETEPTIAWKGAPWKIPRSLLPDTPPTMSKTKARELVARARAGDPDQKRLLDLLLESGDAELTPTKYYIRIS